MNVTNTEAGHRAHVGKRVKVDRVLAGRGYTEEAQAKREGYRGETGTIANYSNSHGLCYEVRFRDGIAWFEPDELNLLSCHPNCAAVPEDPPRDHFKMCPNYACCTNEKRDMDGWCVNCGDPCL
jgi:hypothetical protein